MPETTKKKGLLPPLSLASDSLSDDARADLQRQREELAERCKAALDARNHEELVPAAQEMAEIELSLGLLDEALASYRRVVKLLKGEENAPMIAAIRYAMAEIERAKGRLGEAEGSYSAAQLFFEQAGDMGARATCLLAAGEMCLLSNRAAVAGENLAKAIDGFRDLDDPLGHGLALFRNAEAMATIDTGLAKEQLAEAKELFERADTGIAVDPSERVANTPLPNPERDLRSAEPWLLAKLCDQRARDLGSSATLQSEPAAGAGEPNKKLLIGACAAAAVVVLYALTFRTEAETGDMPPAVEPPVEKAAKAPARPVVKKSRAELLLERAQALHSDGDVDGARSAYERSLEVAEASNDAAVLGATLVGLAELDVAAGDREAALERLRGAQSKLAVAGDTRGEVAVTIALAELAEDLGDNELRIKAYRRQVELYDGSGEPELQIEALENLVAHYWAKDTVQARTYLLKLLPLHEKSMRTARIAHTLERLAVVELATEVQRPTRSRLERAFALYRENRDTDGQARALIGLGDLEMVNEQPRQARAAYRQAVTVAKAGADPATQRRALMQLAAAERDLGQARRATDLLNEALTNCRVSGDPDCRSEIEERLRLVGTSRG